MAFLVSFLVFFFIGVYQLQAMEGLYKWIDEQGVIHIVDSVDKIPEPFRDKAELIKFKSPFSSSNSSPPINTSFQKSSNSTLKTDRYGRNLSWYLGQKKQWQSKIKWLTKQIEENEKAMNMLRRNSAQAKRGQRTKYGIIFGEGPFLDRWAEYYRLQAINTELKKELEKAQYMVKEGLIRTAAKAFAPKEWIDVLRKDP